MAVPVGRPGGSAVDGKVWLPTTFRNDLGHPADDTCSALGPVQNVSQTYLQGNLWPRPNDAVVEIKAILPNEDLPAGSRLGPVVAECLVS